MVTRKPISIEVAQHFTEWLKQLWIETSHKLVIILLMSFGAAPWWLQLLALVPWHVQSRNVTFTQLLGVLAKLLHKSTALAAVLPPASCCTNILNALAQSRRTDFLRRKVPLNACSEVKLFGLMLAVTQMKACKRMWGFALKVSKQPRAQSSCSGLFWNFRRVTSHALARFQTCAVLCGTVAKHELKDSSFIWIILLITTLC